MHQRIVRDMKHMENRMSDYPVVDLYHPDRFPQFHAPTLHPKYYGVMYDVSGETRAENYLATLAREALLSHLRTDECLTARLQEWSVSIGLPAIERDIADFLDRVAKRFGLARRADLVRATRPPHISIEDLLPEWHSLLDRLYAAYGRLPEVVDAARACVHDEWRLPWPWLVFRLVYDMFEQAHERALGITFVRQRTSYLDDHVHGAFVPHVTFLGFETKDGELLAEAIQRYMDTTREHCRTLQAMAITGPEDLPKGRLRKDQERNMPRNVRWFYEERICGKSEYQMAKERHAERPDKHKKKAFPGSCSCRNVVTKGLKGAEKLLGMSPYFF
jgi:hypothetical protein